MRDKIFELHRLYVSTDYQIEETAIYAWLRKTMREFFNLRNDHPFPAWNEQETPSFWEYALRCLDWMALKYRGARDEEGKDKDKDKDKDKHRRAEGGGKASQRVSR